jgi:hypothetical protein
MQQQSAPTKPGVAGAKLLDAVIIDRQLLALPILPDGTIKQNVLNQP